MKSFLRRFFVLALILIALFSCKKENTAWNTDWSAPLVNDTLSLENLVNDSTLEYDGNGYYNIILNRTLLDLKLDDLVAIPDTTIEKKFSIVFAQLNIPPDFTFVDQAEENEIYPGDAELKAFRVKSGEIEFTLKNPLQTGAYITVDLPGALNNSTAFQETIFVPAASGGQDGQVTSSYNIKGYMFDLTGLNGNKSNLFVSQVSVLSDPAGQTVTMYNTDSIIFDAKFKGVKLDYARGYFGNTIVSDTLEQFIDALSGYESGLIDLPNLSLSFEIENGVKLGSKANISLVRSENKQGTIVELSSPSINSPFNVDPATGGWYSLNPSNKTIGFISSNSNIESFLENLGNKYTLGYSLETNPYGNISGGWDELFPSSRLRIKLRMNMPLAANFDNLVLKDTFDISLTPPQSGNRVEEASFILKTQNSFPLGAEVTLYLINKNGNLAYTIPGLSEILSGQEGSIDVSSGLSTSSSMVEFLFDEEIISNLSDITQVVIKAKLKTPNPSTGLNESYSIPAGANMIFNLRVAFKMTNEL